MNETDPTDRKERYGKTERRHITLSLDAIEQIEAYAATHHLYFSVALESLALMGLGQQTAETLPRLVANLLERIVNRQFNRFAKLLSQTATIAAEVNWKADVLLLQHIWREARADPAGFRGNLNVSRDPADELAVRARQLHDQVRQDAHQIALEQLKAPLAASDALLTAEVEVGDE